MNVIPSSLRAPFVAAVLPAARHARVAPVARGAGGAGAGAGGEGAGAGVPVGASAPVSSPAGVGFLILTVLAVSTKAVPKSGSGVAIGAALLAGLLATHGVLNPAIALAMGLGLSAALWAPLVGALVFAPLAVLYLPTAGGTPAPTGDDTGAEAPAGTPAPAPSSPAPAPRAASATRAWRAAGKTAATNGARRDEGITFTARRE